MIPVTPKPRRMERVGMSVLHGRPTAPGAVSQNSAVGGQQSVFVSHRGAAVHRQTDQQTNQVGCQEWERGIFTEQSLCCPAALLPAHLAPAEGQRRVICARCFLPDCLNNVSKCAKGNAPELGCSEDLGSLFSCCLCSPPTACVRFVPKFRFCIFMPCQRDKALSKTVT